MIYAQVDTAGVGDETVVLCGDPVDVLDEAVGRVRGLLLC